MSNDNCCSGSFKTFLTGAILGAFAALLLTPRTGKENRQTLADYGERLKESMPDELREKTEETIDRGRVYLDEKKKALNDAIEAGKVAMEEEKDVLTTALNKEEE